jgi:hypothetical protein
MAGIFINYRREDAPGVAGRLFDHLATKFSRRLLFMDVDAMKPGIDFVKQLDAQVAQCSVLIAVIGPHWLNAQDQSGRRRLESSNDYVRIELASALKRDIPVIPVLVDGATMPSEESLSDDLKSLARRHALELRHTRFNDDAEAILRALRELVAPRGVPWRLVVPGALAVAGVAALIVFWPQLKAKLNLGVAQPEIALQRPPVANPPAAPSVDIRPPPPPQAATPTPANPPALAGTTKPPAPAPAPGVRPAVHPPAASPTLPVAFGDPMDKVRAIYNVRGEPANGCGTTNPCLMLAAPLDGLTFFFKTDGRQLYEIRADAPFAGSIEGVHIGDAFDDVIAKMGQPRGKPLDFGGNKAYVFSVSTGVFRCDFDNSRKCVTIFYFEQ